MDRGLRALLLALALGVVAWAVLRWPHLDTVETGRTPEYPDLRPRDYPASEAEVSRAVKAALDRLGWQFVRESPNRLGLSSSCQFSAA